MRTITLTAADGETLTGTLPDSWHEVPLLPYSRLAAADTLPDRVSALAALVGLPADPLLNDVKHYAAIMQAAPWLAQLPPDGEAVDSFKHLGQRYQSVGALRTLTAGQLEAIYTMQQAYEGRPLEAAPGILAVLFVPKGKTLTAELHQASTAALATLPVSVAWPCMRNFIASGATATLHIATFLAASAQANLALDSLETALQTSSASTRFWRPPLRWALRRWIKSARATASMP